MDDAVPGRTSPSLLADRLAELDLQLRRFHPPAGGPAAAPAELVRIDLALRLLADYCGPDPTLARLEAVFAGLSRSLTDVPERSPGALSAYWRALAVFLDGLLARADRGFPAAEILGDPGWDAQAQALVRAGGPLAILDELQERLETWLRTWGGRDLDPATRARLLHGWSRLRALADDALAGKGGTSTGRNARP